jgi:hypothetical protein
MPGRPLNLNEGTGRRLELKNMISTLEATMYPNPFCVPIPITAS